MTTPPTTPDPPPGPGRITYSTRVLVAVLVAFVACFAIYRIVEHHEQNAASSSETASPSQASPDEVFVQTVRTHTSATDSYLRSRTDAQLLAGATGACEDMDNGRSSSEVGMSFYQLGVEHGDVIMFVNNAIDVYCPQYRKLATPGS